MRLKTNDTVQIIKGRDRGKSGRITKTFPEKNVVLVEGMNVVKRHTKATPGVRQAGIIQKELPLQVANVMLVCNHCVKPTRIGTKMLADGTKARVCIKCREVIE
jgi:large subunit ribosomal protein L24|tara:strand:- start:176 stop:487 length:312 start_codon:yes stop_codon:yes gene_type:complete